MSKTKHYKNNKKINKTTKKRTNKRKIKKSKKTKNNKAKGSTYYFDSKMSFFDQSKEDKLRELQYKMHKLESEITKIQEDLRNKMEFEKQFEDSVLFDSSEMEKNKKDIKFLEKEYKEKVRKLNSLIRAYPLYNNL